MLSSCCLQSRIMIHDSKCDMIGCSMFFFTSRTPLQTLVTITGNGAEMITRIMRLPWPLNPAWSAANVLMCAQQPPVVSMFPIFPLGSMHLCFGCNPRDPNGRSVVRKFPILTRNPLKSLYERLRPRRPPYQGLIHRNPWYNRNSWTGVTKVCKKTPPW